MCQRTYLFTLIGFLAGLLLLAAGGYYGAGRLMVLESDSPLDFPTTVDNISKAALQQGWQVPKVYRLCESLARQGHQVRPVAVIELCKPDYAAELLAHDATRLVSSLMPCRISVYERDDGRVVVSRMNTGLMSRLFPEQVGRVMDLATRETRAILRRALGT
jgi:uncharacterized protein (DUF302 family)